MLVIAVGITATLAIILVVDQGKSAAAEYRQEELKKVQDNVKDYVEMAVQSIESSYKAIDNQAYLEKFYGLRLQSIMDIAVATIKKRAQQVEAGELRLEEAQRQAIRDIEAMRFDNNTGYLWINDTTRPYPVMIMHPTVPALNGTLLTDPKFDCAMGRNQNLFQAAVEVATANGSGFVNYIWPKPTPSGVSEPVKKLSFVHHYQDWGWVLGTGIYLDDAQNDIVNSILENLKTLKYDEGEGYFFVTDMQLPYPTMVMHPTVATLNGKTLDDESFNCVKGTHENLFQVMAEKAKEEGGGYVEYIWPNPLTNNREPKLSYVKRFEPMNWVIGTGSFINHIDEKVLAKEEEINDRVTNIIYIIIGISIILLGAGYWATAYMANGLTKAINIVKDSLQRLSVGKSIQKLRVRNDNEIGVMNASLNNLVDGINSYSSFAKQIGDGNLEADFKPLSDEDTLGNALVQMRDNLKKLSSEEHERKWHAEGMVIFNDLIRKYDNDLHKLCNALVNQVAKYMKINQCGLYLLDVEEGEDNYLELYACYAYDRKRHRTKKVHVGEGLLGQSVLEKQPVYMTEVPKDYVTITSGLGEATPSVILILPLIYNEEVQGAMEIASFRKLELFEIDFLKKIAENTAASVSSSKTAERTRILLEETKQMSEEMKAQEEELRQNNEELVATQEEMQRKLVEIEKETERQRNS